MKHSIVILMSLAYLTACAANPQSVKAIQGNEQMLNCSQLQQEYQHAQQLQKNAHKDDRFRLRYMMPTTGLLSVFNIMKADYSATKRMRYLQQVMNMKQCSAYEAAYQQPSFNIPQQSKDSFDYYYAMPQQSQQVQMPSLTYQHEYQTTKKITPHYQKDSNLPGFNPPTYDQIMSGEYVQEESFMF